jgi:hypothetical protein
VTRGGLAALGIRCRSFDAELVHTYLGAWQEAGVFSGPPARMTALAPEDRARTAGSAEAP